MTRWIAVSLGLLAGCGAADSTDTEKAPLPPMAAPDRPAPAAEPVVDRSCPTSLEGVQVTSEVTTNGAALVFTADGGDVGELQSRVKTLASRYGSGELGGTIAARASVDETGTGAKLLLVPLEPAQLGALREYVRVHGQEMASGSCGTMSVEAEKKGTPAATPPPAGREPSPIPGEPQPTPAPVPSEPVIPDRPVTPDQPVTPPTPPDPVRPTPGGT
jgi:hypothetical protein